MVVATKEGTVKIVQGNGACVEGALLAGCRFLSASRIAAMANRVVTMSEGTVKNYVTNVLQKIGVRDRTQAALRGRELGLI